MITPPGNVEVHESKGGTWWIDGEGILYSVGKNDAPKPTKEESEEQMAALVKEIGKRKVCMILDITHAKPPSREDRDVAAVQLEELVKAMAMVTTSPLGKMVANLFFGLKPPSYPVKIFSTVNEAQKWIRQYL